MMTESRLYDAFDDCLARLSAGGPLASCLEQHPDLAAELRPALEAAQAVMAASRVPHGAEMGSRARFLAAAAERRSLRPNALAAILRRSLGAAIALIAAFVLGATGLYYASASTLPGDGLYPVKRTFESVRIRLAADPAEQLELEREYSQRREDETATLVSEGRAAEVNFGGVLTGRAAADWQVGGFTVRLTDDTEIVGDPQIGFYVDVTAELDDGRLTATAIVAREREVTGKLARAGSRWAINGETFTILPETILRGTVESDATATARLRTLHSGDVVAVSLTILAPATATPSATATATSTPAPSATPTSEPTQTSAPSRTLEPSEMHEPTELPESPEPSKTKEPGQTHEPSKPSESVNTPKPSETHEPSRTPEPDHVEESGGGNGGDGGGDDGGGDEDGDDGDDGDGDGGDDD